MLQTSSQKDQWCWVLHMCMHRYVKMQSLLAGTHNASLFELKSNLCHESQPIPLISAGTFNMVTCYIFYLQLPKLGRTAFILQHIATSNFELWISSLCGGCNVHGLICRNAKKKISTFSLISDFRLYAPP